MAKLLCLVVLFYVVALYAGHAKSTNTNAAVPCSTLLIAGQRPCSPTNLQQIVMKYGKQKSKYATKPINRPGIKHFKKRASKGKKHHGKKPQARANYKQQFAKPHDDESDEAGNGNADPSPPVDTDEATTGTTQDQGVDQSQDSTVQTQGEAETEATEEASEDPLPESTTTGDDSDSGTEGTEKRTVEEAIKKVSEKDKETADGTKTEGNESPKEEKKEEKKEGEKKEGEEKEKGGDEENKKKKENSKEAKN